MANLRARSAGIGRQTAQGVVRAQLLIRRDAVIATPIDTGNLRGSATTPPPTLEMGQVVGRIAYTAAYAPYVHENLEANFNAPGTGPKFLENAVLKNQEQVLRILGSAARQR